MSKRSRRQLQRTGGSGVQRMEFSAEIQMPVPPPEMLERYEQLYPGFTARWLGAMDVEAEHRRSVEDKLVAGSFKLAERGQMCALAIALGGLGAGSWLFGGGHEVGGAILVGTTLLSLVTAFLGSRPAKREGRASSSGSSGTEA